MADSDSKMVHLVDGTSSTGSSNILSGSQRSSWDNIVAGGWHLYAAINQGLSDAGIPQTQDWRVLEALSRHERLRISDLASITQISLSTVSRQITRLVEAGRVERIDVDCDARQRWVRVTAEGSCYLSRVAKERDQMVKRHLIDVLTPEEFAALGAIFGKVHVSLLKEYPE
ncbi:MarR family transcriptional regulator [Gordonia sp. TBRC 11910]|uniref:MarR family transcriptional regulator n=1 Tax=Gordonia asplenii TaxID=2725283 RepID=A0A848KY35_9ACTN|nr:MarR family transcriptional regulator [Gordonia asplenii]NMO01765.1 MarR family transcriptional regulator [Gordonia asplenii]